MPRNLALFFILLIPLLANATGVYKTIGKDGKITYTDVPPDETSQELKLPKGNTIPGLKPNDDQKSYRKDSLPTTYTLKIIAPVNDSTYFVNDEKLPVKAQSTPPFKAENHTVLQILLDDKVLATSTETVLTVGNLDRGSHSLTARIIDAKGKTLTRSEPVMIHIRKPVAPKPKKR